MMHRREDFYPIASLKRANVAVVIRWGWYEGPATRIRHPRKKVFMWATYVDGEPIWLPRGAVRGHLWSDLPYSWRPADLETRWPDPLPDPLPVDVERMARVDAVGRRQYRLNEAGKLEDPETEYTGSEWWRDAGAIVYQPPGEVDGKMVEGRLMRALADCGHRQGLTLAARTAGDALAEAIDEAERARNPEVAGSEWRPAFKPTPADQSDFDVAMAWWTALNPPELWHNSREAWAINMQQKVLLWRSIPLPMSFAEIAVKHRMTRQRVNFLYHDGLEKCFRAANGLRVHRHVIVRDRLADVREGNRAAKRLRTDDGPRVMDRVQESDPLDEISGGPSHAARQSR